jgi:hypothetical protein
LGELLPLSPAARNLAVCTRKSLGLKKPGAQKPGLKKQCA